MRSHCKAGRPAGGKLAAVLLAAGLLLPAWAMAQGTSGGKLRAAPPTAEQVQPRLRSGNWHLAVAVEIEPRVIGPATPPMDITRCLGPRQVDELMTGTPGAVCVPQVDRFTRDLVEWRHACRHGATVAVAQGRIDFRDTRLDGTIVTTSPDSGLRITTRIAGRYLGACVDTAAAAPSPGPGSAAGPQVLPARPGERLPRYVAP